MSKRNICDIHKEIQEYANQIMKMKESQFESIEDALYDIRWIAEQIDSAVDEALEAGQSMEDRLSDYRNAIEDLGFKRVK